MTEIFLLTSAAFEKLSIPGLINFALTIGTESPGGKILRSKFWSVVLVVLVTAAAAAIIGGVIAAAIVYVSAELAGASAAAIATAVTAASWTGFYVGAGVGTVIGIVEGSMGNCPADGWFDTSIPLIDWEENCF